MRPKSHLPLPLTRHPERSEESAVPRSPCPRATDMLFKGLSNRSRKIHPAKDLRLSFILKEQKPLGSERRAGATGRA